MDLASGIIRTVVEGHVETDCISSLGDMLRAKRAHAEIARVLFRINRTDAVNFAAVGTTVGIAVRFTQRAKMAQRAVGRTSARCSWHTACFKVRF